MGGGALDDTMEADRLLGRDVGVVRQPLQLLVEEALELPLQLGDVSPAVAHDLDDVGVVEQGVEHVLDAEELVPPPPCLAHGQGQTDLELSTDAH